MQLEQQIILRKDEEGCKQERTSSLQYLNMSNFEGDKRKLMGRKVKKSFMLDNENKSGPIKMLESIQRDPSLEI